MSEIGVSGSSIHDNFKFTAMKRKNPSVVLTIAGFDPSSGAGISADLMTFSALGYFGVAAITALTVQSTLAVRYVEPVRSILLSQTLDELWSDFNIRAIKLGMLGTAEVVLAVARFLEQVRCKVVVVDPVFISSSGMPLLDASGIKTLKHRILPLATVITPNWDEAQRLTGIRAETPEQWEKIAVKLQSMGPTSVIITGGHSPANEDLALGPKGKIIRIKGPKVHSRAGHGTGCIHSSALTCYLLENSDVFEAARLAKRYVRMAFKNAPGLGHGNGPLGTGIAYTTKR